MTLLSFILSCWGITQILCYGKIFDKVRPKEHFWTCPMCIGFHVGWIIALFCMKPMSDFFFLDLLLYGGISSATSYALCTLFGDEGINLKKN